MKHIRPVSNLRPQKAQLTAILQLIGVLDSLLSLYVRLTDIFGIAIPQKGEE